MVKIESLTFNGISSARLFHTSLSHLWILWKFITNKKSHVQRVDFHLLSWWQNDLWVMFSQNKYLTYSKLSIYYMFNCTYCDSSEKHKTKFPHATHAAETIKIIYDRLSKS